jgi:hypothetical protein
MDEKSGSKGNRGELAEQILDRIASDAEFRQQLLNNPAEALKQAGYNTSDEVSGYGMSRGAVTTAIGCGQSPSAGPAGSGASGGSIATTAMGCGGGGRGGDVATTAIGCGGGGAGSGVPGPDPPEYDKGPASH